MVDLELASKTPGGVTPVRAPLDRRAHAAASSPASDSPAVVLDLSQPPLPDDPALATADMVASWRRIAAAGRLWRAEIDKAVDDARRLITALGRDGDPVAARVTDSDIEELRRQFLESFLAEPAYGLTSGAVALSVENVTLSLRQGGRTVELSVRRVSLQASFTQVVVAPEQGGQEDPLVLDLAGDGVDLAPRARRFDLDGDGDAETVTWVRGDDALLALDRDGDGRITSGKELFGDQHGAADGFAELAKFDDDGNGVIDARDRVWRSLLVVREHGDPVRLEAAGVTSLRFDVVRRLDQAVEGGRLVSAGSYTTGAGQVGAMVDALFDVSA